MQKFIQKTGILTTVALFVLSVNSMALEVRTIEGTIQGFSCMMYGKDCAGEQRETHLEKENIFVIIDDNNDYHIITNIDRLFMTRAFLRKARITGVFLPKDNVVEAESLEIFTDGAWQELWSVAAEKIEREMWWPGPDR